MFKHHFFVGFWAVLCVLSMTACYDLPELFVVISPEQGQLIRDSENFTVEIEVASEFFDPITLQAEINGIPLAVTPGASNYFASLPSGKTLAASNELVVSVLSRSDGTPECGSEPTYPSRTPK